MSAISVIIISICLLRVHLIGKFNSDIVIVGVGIGVGVGVGVGV